MIRGNTLLTLAVVLGLAYVIGKEAETEKRQDGESLLSDIEPDVADAPEDEKKEDNVNDPKWRFRYRYRYRKRYRYRNSRYRRSTPYPTHTPSPTQNPTTPEQPCSTSRPPAKEKWANDWQGHMFFECPRGSTIIYINSVFRECQHDRIWEFGCGYNEASTSRGHCHWDHGYVNDPKKGIFFNCPNHGFIAGVSSDYFSGHGDRRFTFKCCNDEEFDHVDCHHSHLLKGSFEYKVDRDKRFYITGINSYYIAGKRDRDWKVDFCRSEPEYFGSAEGYVSDPEESDVIKN